MGAIRCVGVMNPLYIEHIGIAVRDLEGAIGTYETLLGVKCHGVEFVEDQGVRTAFFLVGKTKIELLESSTPDGPIARFLEKKGGGIHHLAIAVGDLSGTLIELASKGVRLIDAAPRQGAEGLSIAFVHPKSTGGALIELCEHPGNIESPPRG